ncbi:hypothetical protein niasHT_036447 [Heterodera trifolii]|uniref:SXP/RAL-2 family protein Ani s 5-like cation-binding domain-containing protein n=1 Tax=Heterodera trifolii TaxID=157864 RepID=A0ABD2J2A5_9BILA
METAFQQIPSDVLSVLPKNVAAQLEAIQNNGTLTVHEKAEQIDQIMTEQPSEMLDKIPDPPNFGILPVDGTCGFWAYTIKLDSYLYEFLLREDCKRRKVDSFEEILLQIVEFMPPNSNTR